MSSSFGLRILSLGLMAGVAAASAGRSLAQEPNLYTLVLQADAFTPADLKIPAGKPFTLRVVNKDAIGVEIEAKDMKIEKVVAAGSEMLAHVKALTPGKYLVVNEYKEDSVKTFIEVE